MPDNSFNLLDRPWVSVRFSDGNLEEVGLLKLFSRLREIRSIEESSPTSMMALHRLLSVIVWRSLAQAYGHWKDADRIRWYEEGLPTEAILGYLNHWRSHFDLFDPKRPIMQAPVLREAEETRDRLKPYTQIVLDSTSGNAPVLFDHSVDTAPRSIEPKAAFMALLGYLQFTPGGLVQAIRGSDKAGPLANTAAVLPIGSTLNETLCLALHPPSAEARQRDLPCWERPAPSIEELRAEPTLAIGPNDRYTRLSRAVLFVPEPDGSIRWLHFAAGIALGEDPHAPDPMASYKMGTKGLVRLTFNEGRAFWRDLPALVPDASGQASHPAAVLGYASALHSMRSLDTIEQPIIAAGLASDQAKLLRWRSEQVVLPVRVLAEEGLALALRKLMGEAEDLFSELRQEWISMLATLLPDSASKDSRARARELFDRGPAPATYFSGAERALGALLNKISIEHYEEAHALWSGALRRAARTAWSAQRALLGQTPEAMRADAKYWPRFSDVLRRRLPE